MEDTLKNKLKYLINKKKTLLEICETLELKDYEVIGLVELMKQDGELLDYVNLYTLLKKTKKNMMCISISALKPKQDKRYLNFYLKSDILYLGDNMSDLLNLILSLGALLISGLICSF